MNRTILAVALVALAIAGAVAYAQPVSQSPLVEMPPGKGTARAGACAFPIGGWTIIDCSNAAAAQSAALNRWSRYVMQCGVNSYVAWGDASTDEADSSDGYIPAGSWLEFVTTDVVRYASCLNIGSDSDCRIIECL
jgi:hypothetical protein